MVLGGTPDEVDRDALVRQYVDRQARNDAEIRELVLKYGRKDVLAREVLGFEVKPFHMALMLAASRGSQSLHLAFRGSGKSTVVTVVGVLFDIIRDPDVRICIASQTQGWASDLLRQIKAHIEGNEKFIRIFGDLVGETWNQDEIIVSTRQKPQKEPTVLAVGVGGQVVGKHFDRIYGDDLVIEETARTEVQREKLKTWWYKSFKPTFEPHAQVRIVGTRYHFDDLYGHFQKHEFSDCTQIIRALEPRGSGYATPWPEKFSVAYFLDLRESAGLIIFNSQYQCDTEAMKGEIFQFDDMEFISPDELPKNDISGFAGVDLAIKTNEQNDLYARVGIATDKSGNVYVLTSKADHLRFSEQTRDIGGAWQTGLDGWFEPGASSESKFVEIGIENNAYQDAQVQRVSEEYPGIRVVPIQTIIDKVTRAWKLQPMFQQRRVKFVGKHNKLVEALVLFPNGNKDLFDALDIAITTAFRPRRARRRRTKHVGVL